MESNLLHNVKAYFTDEVINKLSANLGETSENVHKGIDLSIPSLLLGLQGKSGDGLGSILNSAKHLFSSFDINNLFGNYFGSPAGTDNSKFETQNILGSIFGDKLGTIVDSLSSYLGIRSESISSLLGASLPAVISGITQKGSDWDSNSIGSLLNSNKSAIAAALPSGLGLGAFGTLFAQADSPTELPRETQTQVKNDIPHTPVEPLKPRQPEVVHTQERIEEGKKGAGLWWLLIPILLIALWLIFGKGCDGDTKEVVLRDSIADADTTIVVTNPVTQSEKQYIDVKLPDGASLKAYSSGIEENLIAFLQSDYKSLSDDQLKEKWFDFDNLNFETGTANVLPESQQQLENIASILKLFPDAKIKIGGYTDKTGNEEVNKRISENRAEAVKSFLESKGLGNQVEDAEGYGSEFATVPADATDAERAKDRRVAVSVRK
ncbi:OmpA family protein [Sphingobacterium bovistauri]|uniref:OmpA family protein n=1 Tax=Sphingobacterium bovistauri TaxID=2781959 RepID=A0ABS7Z861_9SPHI|nr:OmpA family protein [Sphingobacterium bovistauri]MCA5004874.1 OmpA family protein [Sphingobacterium bovistauri]